MRAESPVSPCPDRTSATSPAEPRRAPGSGERTGTSPRNPPKTNVGVALGNELRVKLAVLLLGALTLWIVGTAAARAGVSVIAHADSPVIALEQGGLRFEFHTMTGSESLWDLRRPVTDRVNLLDSRADDARRLRDRLMRELQVRDLSELRRSQSETIERLRALGYL